jgi:hypothetical protein
MDTKTLDDLFEIAADLEPDYINWSYGEHSWCFDFVDEARDYLKTRGIKTRPSYLNSNLFKAGMLHHVWIELEDGLIVDPTIKQFFLADKNYCRCLDSCRYCRPKLSQKDYLNSSFWLVERNDSRRSLYLYLDNNGKVLANAREAFLHPSYQKEHSLSY